MRVNDNLHRDRGDNGEGQEKTEGHHSLRSLSCSKARKCIIISTFRGGSK